MKSIGKNAILNVMKTTLSLIFPLITYPYITRVLKIEAIGRYNFASSIINYFILLAGLGIATYGVREGAKYRNSKKACNQFVSEIFSINIYSTIISYLVLGLCLVFIPKFAEYKIEILILSLGIILTTLSVNWIYNIFEDFTFITAITCLAQIISLILMFIFVHEKEDLYSYIVITVLSTNGAGIIMFFHSRKYVNLHFVPCPSRSHMMPILIVFSSTIATSIYINSDTTILGWMVGDYSVGLYSTAAKIYQIVKQVLNAIIAVTIPRFAFYMGFNEDKEIAKLGEKLLNYMIFFCFPAMVGLYELSGDIIEIFAGKDYSGATQPLQFLSIALIFAVFANFFANGILIVYKKEKIVMIATMVSAAINIILNFILIPTYRENAAAFTTLIAELSMFLISFFYARTCIKFKYNIKNIIFTVLGCCIIGVSCSIIKKTIDIQFLRLISAVVISSILYFVAQIIFGNPIIEQILFKMKKW